MNILLYAENHIFPFASSEPGEDLLEQYREKIYDLYNLALQLEPERKPELSFAQRMLVNKARSFITMKMKRRMELRQMKQGKKAMKKMKMMLSDKIMAQMQELKADQAEREQELAQSLELPV